MQQAVKQKRLIIVKIAGTENPVDHLTKPLGLAEMSIQIARIGCRLVLNWEMSES